MLVQYDLFFLLVRVGIKNSAGQRREHVVDRRALSNEKLIFLLSQGYECLSLVFWRENLPLTVKV